MSAHRCSGEHAMHHAGDVRVECCGSSAAGKKAHAEVCALSDHDDCDVHVCSCGDAAECPCPCDACQDAKAAALAYEAEGDGPEPEDYE